MRNILDNLLLLIIFVFIFDAFLCHVDILSVFYHGVLDGLKLFKTLFPSLLAFMLMVMLLEASGIIGFISHFFNDFVPSSILALAIFRPISSNASLSFLSEVFSSYGPDSLYGIMASLMQGATDTTLYVTSVYFSQTHVKKSGYILPLCLCLDVLAIILAIIIAYFITT